MSAEIAATVSRMRADSLGRVRDGATVIRFMDPRTNTDLVQMAEQRNLTTIPFDMIPRITLAQDMDVLSLQANLAGYWVVVALEHRVIRSRRCSRPRYQSRHSRAER
jgi:NAD(P) transhydrogenase subunit alpha